MPDLLLLVVVFLLLRVLVLVLFVGVDPLNLTSFCFSWTVFKYLI